jgi:uncharacterized protein YoaH (UPF0181 family)
MTPGNDTAEIDLQPLKESLRPAPDAPSEVPCEITVRTLDQFSLNGETIVKTLAGIRWLCRGSQLLLCAPTGIGKSSLNMQIAISFALGLPFFGIKPSGKLKVLIIQAENDDGDMAEFRDGIFRGMGLTKEQQAEACQRIQVVYETVRTGGDFVALVAEVAAKHKPDLIIVDPLFSYLGDSVNEQKAVSTFLRNGLNPILQEHDCGLILVHHTNKPPKGTEKLNWQGSDFAYLGSGTSELANWARAVLVIRSIGSHEVFEVQLGKRGRRAGLVNDEGQPIYQFYIKHSTSGICWEPATEDDLPSEDSTGRHAITIKDVVATFGDGLVLQYSKLVEALIENHGVSDRTAKKAIARAKSEGKICKAPSGVYELSSQKGEQ